MSDILIQQYQIGPLDNFLYLLGDPVTKEMAIVDPAWDVPFLRREAERLGYTISKVFLTHGHPDHVNGLGEILSTHDIPVYMSRHEAPYYKPKGVQLTEIENGEALSVGNLTFDTIRTPGHTPGCQCFKYQNHMITGDAIFIDGCGRCDLPGGDPSAQYDTLYNIFMKLPDDTILYTGHNYGPKPTDTIGGQKKTNPYLQCSSKEEFLSERM